MQCPKCGSGVPDGSTQCHICFAELEPSTADAGPIGLQAPQVRAQPQGDEPQEVVPGIPGLDRPGDAEVRPNYLQPQASLGDPAAPGVLRTSLTGDVYEAPAAPPAGPAPGMAPRPSGPLPPMQPAGGAPSPYTLPPRREVAAPKSGAGPLVAILVVVLLAGAGAGGWWWWQKQHGPAAALTTFLEALKSGNSDAATKMIAWPPEMESQMGGGAGGKAQGEQFMAGVLKMAFSMIKITAYSIGDVTQTGDTAKVKATVTAQINLPGMATTRSDTSTIDMKRVDGQWKVDFSGLGRAMGGAGAGRAPRGGPGGMPGFPGM